MVLQNQRNVSKTGCARRGVREEENEADLYKQKLRAPLNVGRGGFLGRTVSLPLFKAHFMQKGAQKDATADGRMRKRTE